MPELGLRFHLGIDGISSPLVLLTALLTLLCCVYLLRIRPEAQRLRALVGLLLLLEVGMLGTFVALDLLLFFVFFEVVLVPMWFVIAQWGDDKVPAAGSARPTCSSSTRCSAAPSCCSASCSSGSRPAPSTSSTLTSRAGAGMTHRTQVLAFLALALGLAVKAPMWPLHTGCPTRTPRRPPSARCCSPACC